MVAGTSVLLIAIGGGAAGVAAFTRDRPQPRIVTAVGDAAAAGETPAAPPAPGPPPAMKGQVAVRSRTAAEADRSVGRSPVREPAQAGAPAAAKAEPSPALPAAKQAARPVITKRTEVETREIPYPTRVVRDSGLPRGSKRVQTPGVAGEETLRYLVTLTDGRPTDRRLLDSTVTRQPQQEVVAMGSQQSQPATPNQQRGCGSTLNLCVPLGRDSSCSNRREYDRPESALLLGGEVTVGDNDVALLGGGGGGGHGHRHGRGC
jgi:hypothetical protein